MADEPRHTDPYEEWLHLAHEERRVLRGFADLEREYGVRQSDYPPNLSAFQKASDMLENPPSEAAIRAELEMARSSEYEALMSEYKAIRDRRGELITAGFFDHAPIVKLLRSDEYASTVIRARVESEGDEAGLGDWAVRLLLEVAEEGVFVIPDDLD
jgi:hypothetical protein